MIRVKIQESLLKKSASEGMSAFFEVVTSAIDATVGELSTSTMSQMHTDQITLMAYKILREEVMEGGFVQLIHNGYGAFIFLNPFAKALRGWGLTDLAQVIQKAHKQYSKHHADIEADMSNEDFMALYEKHPEFDALDEAFIENEERFTAQIACYVDDHLDNFVEVIV